MVSHNQKFYFFLLAKRIPVLKSVKTHFHDISRIIIVISEIILHPILSFPKQTLCKIPNTKTQFTTTPPHHIVSFSFLSISSRLTSIKISSRLNSTFCHFVLKYIVHPIFIPFSHGNGMSAVEVTSNSLSILLQKIKKKNILYPIYRAAHFLMKNWMNAKWLRKVKMKIVLYFCKIKSESLGNSIKMKMGNFSFFIFTITHSSLNHPFQSLLHHIYLIFNNFFFSNLFTIIIIIFLFSHFLLFFMFSIYSIYRIKKHQNIHVSTKNCNEF